MMKKFMCGLMLYNEEYVATVIRENSPLKFFVGGVQQQNLNTVNREGKLFLAHTLTSFMQWITFIDCN